jgi:ribosome-binding factor A
MVSNKIFRVNEDIQRELSILLRKVKDPRLQGMLSITGVNTTKDLRYAKVYISALRSDEEKEILKGLRSASGFLRRELGAALDLRYTPELVFELDKSIEHGAKISKLLTELETKEDTGESDD